MSRSSDCRKRARARRGFTLLEVLAAVAVLGILFTVLSGVTITGLHAEGINLRRLRASLVADSVLNELEAQLLAGVFPEESSEESERDEFTVQVDVKPLADAGSAGGDADLVAFLEGEVPDLMPLLWAIEVRVSWLEGSQELAVRRTTYAFDQTQWGEQHPELQAPEGLAGDVDRIPPEGESR